MSSATTTSSTISTITGAPATETGGRGRNRTRGSRGRGRGASGGSRTTATSRPARSNFKGATDEMQGNGFECYNEQHDRRQFAKTMEFLEIYAKKKYQHFQDLSSIFAATMAPPVVPVPAEPAGEPSEMEEGGHQELLHQADVPHWQHRGALRRNLGPVQRAHERESEGHSRLRNQVR